MPIKGLTDTITPTLPRLGGIKKGEKTEKGNPRKLPYFVFAVAGKLDGEPETPFERLFREGYGDKPTQIMGMFIGASEDAVLYTAMRAKGKEGKTTRVCDREVATHQLTKKGEVITMERGTFPCGWNGAENKCTFGCKAEGRLSFVLMTSDGSEPLFVNQEGYPLGIVDHRISETDIKQVLGTLRGAMMMTPVLGMVFRLVLREWQHPQYGKIYASNFYFDHVYHRFQRPQLETGHASRPTLELPDHTEPDDDGDSFDNFGVDESELVDEPAIEAPPRLADQKQYDWAYRTYRVLDTELDFILTHKVNKKRLAHEVDAQCKAWANQPVQFSDEAWMAAVWYPFLVGLELDTMTAMKIVDTMVPPDETRLIVYRDALLEANK